jgi:hypothetical protein
MAHVHIRDVKKRAETQLHQKLAVLSASTNQELAEVRPPASTGALSTRILHGKECQYKKIRESTKQRDIQSV